ncbi:MAG: type II toxin-antitoxin system antitoxin VapB [Rhizomicrobium sp.]
MKTAKIFMSGRSQAVRLPKEFRFEGKEVRVRKVGNGVMLEPMKKNWEAIFAEIDKHIDPDFMKDGRDQPPMPPDEDLFE